MIMIIIRNTLFTLEESVSIKNAGLNKMSNVFALFDCLFPKDSRINWYDGFYIFLRRFLWSNITLIISSYFEFKRGILIRLPTNVLLHHKL